MIRNSVLFRILVFALFSFSFVQCAYDNVEDTYGPNSACDTAAVTFSQDVRALIGQNCESCHNGASGGLNLAGHENIQAAALNGSIMNRVTRETGDVLLMPPPPYEPFSECNQNKLRAWINEGAPNN